MPKWPENYFEPFGKSGWPPISTWINHLPNNETIDKEEEPKLGQLNKFTNEIEKNFSYKNSDSIQQVTYDRNHKSPNDWQRMRPKVKRRILQPL